MVDVVDSATRSRMMAGIRGRDTKPELLLRRALHARGFRYRLHGAALSGKPDLVLPKHKAVVFVHGCFWHRHAGCRFATTPATRPEFWSDKFSANVARDHRNLDLLRTMGWRTAIVWECAMKSKNIDDVADEVTHWLQGGEQLLEVSGTAPSAQS